MGTEVGTLVALTSLLAGMAVWFIYLGLRALQSGNTAEKRFRSLVGTYQDLVSVRELELRTPFRERALRPLFRRLLQSLARFSPMGSAAQVQQKLVMAGNPGNLTPVDFLGLRVLAATVLALGGVLGGMAAGRPSRVILFAAIGALLGLIYPNMWLNRRIRRRQKAIQRALPDVLDMLTVAVDAGLGFDAAVLKVTEKWSNPLTEEFQHMLFEMRMGVPRAEALRNMAERTGVPELSTFVAIMVQADRLGASITDVLHAQSQAMRTRRRQWAEEQARKAPIKMLIPLVLFVFPATFVVILGPAVPRIMATFSR